MTMTYTVSRDAGTSHLNNKRFPSDKPQTFADHDAAIACAIELSRGLAAVQGRRNRVLIGSKPNGGVLLGSYFEGVEVPDGCSDKVARALTGSGEVVK